MVFELILNTRQHKVLLMVPFASTNFKPISLFFASCVTGNSQLRFPNSSPLLYPLVRRSDILIFEDFIIGNFFRSLRVSSSDFCGGAPKFTRWPLELSCLKIFKFQELLELDDDLGYSSSQRVQLREHLFP